jgi:hypothetical protein
MGYSNKSYRMAARMADTPPPHTTAACQPGAAASSALPCILSALERKQPGTQSAPHPPHTPPPPPREGKGEEEEKEAEEGEWEEGEEEEGGCNCERGGLREETWAYWQHAKRGVRGLGSGGREQGEET